MNRILIVTVGLVGRSGTEIVTSETAFGLRSRGHEVAIYAPQLGPFGAALHDAGFLVTDEIAAFPWKPDIIQANQTYPLVEAVGRFPDVPCIVICHDATVWYNEPIDLPVIRRNFAVDIACRERVARRLAHLRDGVELLHNAVDLDRYERRPPLPQKPRRALIAAKQVLYVDTIRKACDTAQLDTDVVGPAVRMEVDDLHQRFRHYDIVFASARTALEALAAGCAVVVVDDRGLAGMVTSNAVSTWRDHNFGARILTRTVSVEAIGQELARYDSDDANRVTDYVRQEASLAKYLDRLERIHDDAIAQGIAEPADRDALIFQLSKATTTLVSALETQVNSRTAEWQSRFNAGASYNSELRTRIEALSAELASERDIAARLLPGPSFRQRLAYTIAHPRTAALLIGSRLLPTPFKRNALIRRFSKKLLGLPLAD